MSSERAKDFFENNDYWRKSVVECKQIYIFGAKRDAVDCKKTLNHEKVKGFLVSVKDDNPTEIMGLPVREFADFLQGEKDCTFVVITQKYESICSLEQLLIDNGFTHFMAYLQFIRGFQSYTMMEMRSAYGIGNVIPKDISTKSFSEEQIEKILRVYAVTSHFDFHKSRTKYKEPWIRYIQAGAACTNIRIADITDDTGENVSFYNPQLCEMSAGYWIANNDSDHKYIGLCHYGRGIDLNNAQLKYIIENEYDVIIPAAVLYYEKIIRMGMREVHYDAMLRFDPQNIGYFERHLLGCSFIQGNVLIAKRKIYLEYIQYMFGYLRELKKVMEEVGEPLPPRFLAYASEHITNVFFRIHADKYRIAWVNEKNNIL